MQPSVLPVVDSLCLRVALPGKPQTGLRCRLGLSRREPKEKVRTWGREAGVFSLWCVLEWTGTESSTRPHSECERWRMLLLQCWALFFNFDSGEDCLLKFLHSFELRVKIKLPSLCPIGGNVATHQHEAGGLPRSPGQLLVTGLL